MKQKINTKNLTESEQVVVDDVLNYLVWTKLGFEYRMKEYKSDETMKKVEQVNALLQDNTTTI